LTDKEQSAIFKTIKNMENHNRQMDKVLINPAVEGVLSFNWNNDYACFIQSLFNQGGFYADST
jgi:hypothetical protein